MNTKNKISFSDTKLYIFDLQQTLLNDFEPHFEAHKAIITEYYKGNIKEALDEIIQLWGISVFDVYKKLFGPTLSDNEINTLVERRDQIYIDIFTRSKPKLCEGAKEALMLLKSQNYTIAVVSGIRRNLLETGLKKPWGQNSRTVSTRSGLPITLIGTVLLPPRKKNKFVCIC